MTEFYYQTILEGLSKVPTPNNPGKLVVTGKSQAILTGSNSNDVLLAGYEYGKGKILVCSHTCYMEWINEGTDGIKKDLMDRLKKWLTGDDQVSRYSIGNLAYVTEGFSNFKILLWDENDSLSEETKSSLLDYINEGGSLFAGSTPWGYLQTNPGKTLEEMDLNTFLIKNTGTAFTDEILWLPNEMDISDTKPRFSNYNSAIDLVSGDITQIPLYFKVIHSNITPLLKIGMISHDDIHSIKSSLIDNSMSKELHIFPHHEKPVDDQHSVMASKIIGHCYHYSSTKAPRIEHFPGDFQDLPEMLSSVELTLSAKFPERISTGYYLPAGQQFTCTVISGDFSGWSIRIGAHSDDLIEHTTLKRWHLISKVFEIKEAATSFHFAYGGLVYFENPTNSSTLEVTIDNVVESPYFDLTKPETILDWNRRKNSAGLWAELAGHNAIFTTKAEFVRHLEDPTSLMEFWDKVIQSHHSLRGTDPDEYKRERIVNDMQISAGWLHAGYPIMTHLPCADPDSEDCIYNLEMLIENGNWGLFHELGHNMQRSEWTFESATEVTVNIFSIHAMEFVIGKKLTEIDWLKNPNLTEFFSRKPTLTDWENDLKFALFMYVMMIAEFGWQPMYAFMREYERDINYGLSTLPRSDQEKIDQWVIRYSKLVDRNIKSHFENFGLTVSDHVDEELSELEPWSRTELDGFN